MLEWVKNVKNGSEEKESTEFANQLFGPLI